MFFVEGSFLMRIFTVAHILNLNPLTSQRSREQGAVGNVITLHAGQVIGNHAVVASGMNKDFFSQFQAGFRGNFTVGFDFVNNFLVIRRRNDDGHAFMILGSSTNHCRAADIDIFNGVFECAIRIGDCLFKRIKIDGDDVNRVNIKLLKSFHVSLNRTACQNTCMDLGIQCLYATIKHFRETCVIGHFLYRDACLSDQFGSTTSGKNVVTEFMQFACKFHDSGLIGTANQSLLFH